MSMNHRPRVLRPSPECAEFAPLLALMGQEQLDEQDANDVRQHLATCAYCQREVQGYNTLDAALSRHFGAPARQPLARDDISQIMREDYRPATNAADLQDEPEERFGRQPGSEYKAPSERARFSSQNQLPFCPEKRKRSRKVLSLFSAMAAVLVIGLVTAALFASHNGLLSVGAEPHARALGYE